MNGYILKWVMLHKSLGEHNIYGAQKLSFFFYAAKLSSYIEISTFDICVSIS